MKLPSQPLGMLAEVNTGGTPDRTKAEYWGGTVPWITTGDIDYKTINRPSEYLTELGLKESAAKLLPAGTIIMAMYGQGTTRGKVAILGIEAATNQACAAIFPKKEIINSSYLYSVLAHQYEKIRALGQGGNQQNLNTSLIREISIPLPLLVEQEKIASIAHTWDTAIDKEEELIAAKEKNFLWLLDRLLTRESKKSKWRRVKLGEVGEIASAGVDKKRNPGEDPVRLLNYLDVYRRDLIYSHELTHFVTAPPAQAKRCFVKKGDIFFTPSSEVRNDIGHSAVAMEDMPDVVYSYHIVRLRLHDDWNLLYRAYAFKSQDFYKQAQMLCDGSGQRYVISQNKFRNMEVSIPPIDKQKQIAETLNTAQKEIDLLKRQVEAHRKQKRGLMQKLLTGAWRVKAAGEVL